MVLPTDLYRAQQVREIDRLVIAGEGMSGEVLMERAGCAAFNLMMERFPAARKISILCGSGNNAGDGFIVARLCKKIGLNPTIHYLKGSKALKGDALIAFNKAQISGVPIQAYAAANKIEFGDLIVDALLGTGIDRVVSGDMLALITAVNEATNKKSCPVLAIDIPSGLNADSGAVMGAAIKATLCISFIALKQGMLTADGPDYCGTIYFDDLAISSSIVDGATRNRSGDVAENAVEITQRLTAEEIMPLFKDRKHGSHKGDFGHVLIIGGDHGYIGAVVLAARAACRVGAGLISVATRSEHAALLNLHQPEMMVHGIEDTAALVLLMEKASVIAIGPGLGQGAWAQDMFALIKDVEKPVVIDADALNMLSMLSVTNLYQKDNWVLTPHPGEAGRLLSCDTAQVQQDRFAAIKNIEQKYGGICVLKGAGTLVYPVAGQTSLCSDGNPGMASGGMGDVLTGIIAGLLAQGFTLEDAARAGVWVHARAGDIAAQQGQRGLLASDLLAELRNIVNV